MTTPGGGFQAGCHPTTPVLRAGSTGTDSSSGIGLPTAQPISTIRIRWARSACGPTSAGGAGSSYASLPWGDGYTATIGLAGADQDNEHFAGMEQDENTSNVPMSEHAQFRQYSFLQGRWLAPDPYMGSYDPTNPQSMNRYAYVLNNPLSFHRSTRSATR